MMASFLLRDKFSGEKVPTLQEAVGECIRHHLTIFFDVKGQPDKVVNELTRLKMRCLPTAALIASVRTLPV